MQLAAGARAFFSRKNRRDRSERRTQNTGPWGDSAGPAGLPGSIGRCVQDHVPQGVAGRAQHRECRGQKASGDGDGAEQEIWCIQRSQDEIECACYWQAGARYPSICKLRRCRMAAMFASACRPGHGGPHRHGQRYTKIEDHLAPIVKPLRDSAIKRAEHDPQQLRQPCTFAAKCRAVIPTQAAASVRGSGRPAARFAPITRKSDAPHAMRSRRGKTHSGCKGRFR